MNLPTYIMAHAVLLFCGAVAFGNDPAPEPVVQTCDLVHAHTLYDEKGQYVFTQTIFYEWNQEKARYDVLAWRLIKSSDQWPQRDWKRGGYSVIWDDSGVTRVIRAHAVRVTDTQTDPELEEREHLAKELRKGLRPLLPITDAKPGPPTPLRMSDWVPMERREGIDGR